MMSAEACARFSNGAPQLPIDVLQELHSFLREVPKNLATFKSRHKNQGVSKNEEIPNK
jgi:hypothetical protein